MLQDLNVTLGSRDFLLDNLDFFLDNEAPFFRDKRFFWTYQDLPRCCHIIAIVTFDCLLLYF